MTGLSPDGGPPRVADALSTQTSPCQACGACCAYSREWPRFSMESEAQIARIPPDLVDPSGSGMLARGDRCAALAGEVGVATACTIYADRPEVCRTCEPGDDACTMARARHALPSLPLAEPDSLRDEQVPSPFPRP